MPKRNLDEIHKEGYLTKDEVLDKLEDYYIIEITPRTLKYYGTLGIISSGIKENNPPKIPQTKNPTIARLLFIAFEE